LEILSYHLKAELSKTTNVCENRQAPYRSVNRGFSNAKWPII